MGHTNLQQIIPEQLTVLLGHNNNTTLLLGLSGGPDSVLLFHCLRSLSHVTLHALHMNYGWRATAARDEQFCRDLCAEHDIPLIVTTPAEWQNSIPAHKKAHGSRESLARHARRAAFEHHANTINADGIVLGHHRDDQLETLLIRLIRGSGLTGLCGMHARNDRYLRPALGISRADILSWLHEHEYPYFHDETNNSTHHLRNRIRQTALPGLLAVDDRAAHNMLTTMQHLRDDDELLTQISNDIYTGLQDERGWLPREQFCALHTALQNRLLLLMLIAHRVAFTPSAGLLAELRRFLASPAGGTHAISPEHAVVKKQGWFFIMKRSAP